MKQTSIPNFVQFVGKPKVTSVIAGGRRRLNYTFEDTTEIVEEYDIKTFETARKWKKQSNFKESLWQYEIGEPPIQNAELVPSTTNPIFMRKDTAQHFQFRIRNLPYPEEVYQMDIDETAQEIVIRTTNKKYFKKFPIPDMRRLNLKLQQGKVTCAYKNNTLIVSVCQIALNQYPKPDVVIEREQSIRNEFEKFNKKNPKEGDLECAQQ